jgi:hypothetical protein
MNAHMYVPRDAGSKGFALFCRLGMEDGWVESLRFIEEAGLRLDAPNIAETVITVEPSGGRVHRALAEFRRDASAGMPLLFRVWTEDGDDMLCDFRRDGSIRTELYWFGQLEQADERFVSALLKRFVAEVPAGKNALVVDWHALSENFDWTTFLDGRIGYSGAPPEILGLPLALTRLVSLDLQGFSRTDLNDHVLYRRDGPPIGPVDAPEEIDPKRLPTSSGR